MKFEVTVSECLFVKDAEKEIRRAIQANTRHIPALLNMVSSERTTVVMYCHCCLCSEALLNLFPPHVHPHPTGRRSSLGPTSWGVGMFGAIAANQLEGLWLFRQGAPDELKRMFAGGGQ